MPSEPEHISEEKTKPTGQAEHAADCEKILPFGKNLLGITYIAEDFDAPLSEEILRDFGL